MSIIKPPYRQLLSSGPLPVVIGTRMPVVIDTRMPVVISTCMPVVIGGRTRIANNNSEGVWQLKQVDNNIITKWGVAEPKQKVIVRLESMLRLLLYLKLEFR